jgi:2-hydroxymuconate-semialdehyde hydrolase
MATITTSDVVVGDYTFHVNETGAQGAEAILWLHGSGPGATGHSNWEAAIEVFGETYRCIAPDMIGFGDSTHPADPPQGISAFGELRVATLWGLLDALGLDRVHLVGNSMGGMIALKMVLERPERIGHVTLMGSGGAPVPPMANLIKMIGFYDDPSADSMTDLLTAFVYDPSLFGAELRSIAEARLPRATRADVRRSHLATFNFAAGTPMRFSAEELAGITNEVLVIHGRDDTIISPDNSKFFFEHLPNAELHIFGRCGHWTQIEQPHRFQATLAAFLATRGTA